MALSARWKKLVAMFFASVALAVGVAACGSSSSDSGSSSGGTRDATLILDFIPNAVHAGVYDALANGFYTDNGINLKIIQPTSTADTLKLIDAGKADFGIADGIDLAGQIDQGRGAQGIMAILQRPAGGVITLASDNITSPAELDGKTVGITGVPSDTAILNTIVSNAGGNPADVNAVTIGFNGVQALEGGKVSAFTGFVPADGVQVENDGDQTKSFLLDENGGPSYPGLVAFSTQDMIKSDPALMKGFVDATIKGYQDALANPQKAIDDLVSQTQGVDKSLAMKQFEAYVPLFGPSTTYGQFNKKHLEELSTFLVKNNLVNSPIATSRYADSSIASGGN